MLRNVATRRAGAALAARRRLRGARETAQRASGLAVLAAAATAAGLGGAATCEPINAQAESQESVKGSLSKLDAMISKMTARVFVAPFVDHTLLSADATPREIERLCMEAVQYGFQAVCVNGANVRLCREVLERAGKEGQVKICAVVGFPLGASASSVKAFECMQAIEDGAVEIDMVINVGRVKAQDWDYVLRDIAAVVSVCKQGGAICKVIVETSLLTDDEKRAVAKLSALTGADFVKTSTGFSTGGATVDDVKLLKHSVIEAFRLVPMDRANMPDVQIKASGGLKTAEDALNMLRAGADRLGTSRAASWCAASAEPAAPGAY